MMVNIYNKDVFINDSLVTQYEKTTGSKMTPIEAGYLAGSSGANGNSTSEELTAAVHEAINDIIKTAPKMMKRFFEEFPME